MSAPAAFSDVRLSIGGRDYTAATCFFEPARPRRPVFGRGGRRKRARRNAIAARPRQYRIRFVLLPGSLQGFDEFLAELRTAHDRALVAALSLGAST